MGEGAWKEPLRGFLEAARQFLASAPTQAVAIASAPPSAAVAPEQAAKPSVAPSAPPPEDDTVQSDEGAMMSIQIPAAWQPGRCSLSPSQMANRFSSRCQ